MNKKRVILIIYPVVFFISLSVFIISSALKGLNYSPTIISMFLLLISIILMIRYPLIKNFSKAYFKYNLLIRVYIFILLAILFFLQADSLTLLVFSILLIKDTIDLFRNNSKKNS